MDSISNVYALPSVHSCAQTGSTDEHPRVFLRGSRPCNFHTPRSAWWVEPHHGQIYCQRWSARIRLEPAHRETGMRTPTVRARETSSQPWSGVVPGLGPLRAAPDPMIVTLSLLIYGHRMAVVGRPDGLRRPESLPNSSKEDMVMKNTMLIAAGTLLLCGLTVAGPASESVAAGDGRGSAFLPTMINL